MLKITLAVLGLAIFYLLAALHGYDVPFNPLPMTPQRQYENWKRQQPHHPRPEGQLVPVPPPLWKEYA